MITISCYRTQKKVPDLNRKFSSQHSSAVASPVEFIYKNTGGGGQNRWSLGCHLALKLGFSKSIYNYNNLVTKMISNTSLVLNQAIFS